MSEIQLHERSRDEIFNIAVQLRTDNFIKKKKIEELESQLQQKENITKEVREYIKYQLAHLDFEKDTKAKMLGAMVLVMLDKGK